MSDWLVGFLGGAAVGFAAGYIVCDKLLGKESNEEVSNYADVSSQSGEERVEGHFCKPQEEHASAAEADCEVVPPPEEPPAVPQDDEPQLSRFSVINGNTYLDDFPESKLTVCHYYRKDCMVSNDTDDIANTATAKFDADIAYALRRSNENYVFVYDDVTDTVYEIAMINASFMPF